MLLFISLSTVRTQVQNSDTGCYQVTRDKVRTLELRIMRNL